MVVLNELKRQGLKNIMTEEGYIRFKDIKQKIDTATEEASKEFEKLKVEINDAGKKEKKRPIRGFDLFGMLEIQRDMFVGFQVKTGIIMTDIREKLTNIEAGVILVTYVYENLKPEVRENPDFKEKLKVAIESDVSHLEKKKNNRFLDFDVSFKVMILESLKLPDICDPYIKRLNNLCPETV